MDSELVSVIIPCYNAERFVGRAVQSVLNQTYPDVEVIVVDDGSTDGSRDVVASFGKTVRLIEQSNQGACHARNRGAEEAAGEFLMFLDADDRIAPDTLVSLQAALSERVQAVAWCPWKRLTHDGDQWIAEETDHADIPPDDDPIRGWLSGWFVPPCGLLWTREAFSQTGGWDEDLQANQDGDLVLRALLRGTPLIRAEGGKAYYRDHGADRVSVSARSSEEAVRSRARVLEKVRERLQAQGKLDRYQVMIGKKYHGLARKMAISNPELSKTYVRHARCLAGSRVPSGSFLHRIGCRLLGLQNKERLARLLGCFGMGSEERIKTEKLRGEENS